MNRDEVATLMDEAAGQAWGTEEHFQRFAALVAKAAIQDDLLWQAETETAVLAEREACAKVCEEAGVDAFNNDDIIYDICADLIRARKENT
jgi:hypothetical protein